MGGVALIHLKGDDIRFQNVHFLMLHIECSYEGNTNLDIHFENKE